MNPGAPVSSDASAAASRRPFQVISLFPELVGIGGVQEAGRLTAAAISEIVRSQGGLAEYLSLNDPPGQRTLDVAGSAISFRGFGRAKLRFVASALACARRTKPDLPAVVLAAHPNLAVPAVLIRRVSPHLPVVVISHGVEVWTPLPLARRNALRRARIVLAPSRYTAERLARIQGVAKERIRLLPWPLNPEFLQLVGDSAQCSLPPGFPSGPIVLAVGRWAASERYKGADDLIRAVACLRPDFPNLSLVAIGGGDDVPRLSGLAQSLGVADRVRFFSGLSRAQIAACYSHADVFALPSTGEGFGIVFLEAMAFAKPIVAAAAGGAVDLIQDGVNGILIPPHEVRSLSDALATLLADDVLRVRMGRAGAELVQKKSVFAEFRRTLESIIDASLSPVGPAGD